MKNAIEKVSELICTFYLPKIMSRTIIILPVYCPVGGTVAAAALKGVKELHVNDVGHPCKLSQEIYRWLKRRASLDFKSLFTAVERGSLQHTHTKS